MPTRSPLERSPSRQAGASRSNAVDRLADSFPSSCFTVHFPIFKWESARRWPPIRAGSTTDRSPAICASAFCTRDEERDGRYKLALGASYPVGAPKFTRATIVGDVFAEQSVASREPTVVGTEVGLRYQLTPRIVWDVGIGTEFAGPAHRSTFFMTTGFSFGF